MKRWTPTPEHEHRAAPSLRIPDRHGHVIIDGRRLSVLDQVRGAWRFRDLLVVLGMRDVKVRYRQTALGAAWVIAQPLLGALIFAFVFGRVARLPSEGVPYFPFALAGLTLWNFFSAVLTRSGLSLLANAPMLSKIFFPRVVLPVSATASAVVDAGVSVALLLVVSAGYGSGPSPWILTAPALLFVTATLALGVGLITAALSVAYRDLQQLLPVGLQLLLYASPVAYSASAVPTAVQPLYELNPLVGLFDAFRAAAFGTPFDDATRLIYSVGFSLIVLTAGLVLFARREPTFADIL